MKQTEFPYVKPFDKLFDAVADVTDLIPSDNPRADLDWMIDRLYEMAGNLILLENSDTELGSD